MVTLTQVKQAQPNWFSPRNKRFFGDIDYKILHGKKTHKAYFIQHSFKWSDMFGLPKRETYLVKELDQSLLIPMNALEFTSLDNIKAWLKEN